jgi:hypothetical protein
MKITKNIQNLKSGDQFEYLVYFEDGFIVAGSEKQQIIFDPKGKVVDAVYKAGSNEEHGRYLFDGPFPHDPDPVDFDKATAKEWFQRMGAHASMYRGGFHWIMNKAGEVEEDQI